MNCQEVRQCAGEAIDQSLSDDKAGAFEAHLERCPRCRRDVAAERLVRSLIRHHVQKISTPHSAYLTVLSTLQSEYQSNAPTIATSRRVFVPALSGGITALVFFSLVVTGVGPSYPATAHTASNDVINLSLKYFALVKAGKLTPAFIARVPEGVRTFLGQHNLRFDVHVPSVRECDWCGASISEEQGLSQAHLIYKIRQDLVYVSEVSSEEVLTGTRLSLPAAAKHGLTQSGWYTDPDHPECNLVLWKTDGVVCVTVSTMRKGQLLSLLTAH